MKKLYLKIAGVVNIITAIMHLNSGQIELINPLIHSNLTTQVETELTAVWHMVTILLFYSSFVLLKAGFSENTSHAKELLRFMGMLYILMGIPFIICSIYFGIFAPQWILLMPIGILSLLGIQKMA